MNYLITLLVVAAGAVAMTTEARACSIAAPTQHVVDPSMQATDQTPPMLPAIPDAQVTRGKGPKQEGCSQSASSCDDIGTLKSRKVLPICS